MTAVSERPVDPVAATSSACISATPNEPVAMNLLPRQHRHGSVLVLHLLFRSVDALPVAGGQRGIEPATERLRDLRHFVTIVVLAQHSHRMPGQPDRSTGKCRLRRADVEWRLRPCARGKLAQQ
jgi:hypothetical protein